MAVKKKAVAKSADAARKSAMTKTVVRVVSPNVKILKPGSKPMTQTNTEKAAIAAKAKTKTPAARASAREKEMVAKKNLKRDLAEQRRYALRGVAQDALKRAGFDVNQTKFGNKPSAAQTKAVNKAKAAAERKMKEVATKTKAEGKAKRAAKYAADRKLYVGRSGGMRGGGFNINDLNK
jgi:hypothetical protein